MIEVLSKKQTGFLPDSFWDLSSMQQITQLYLILLPVLHDLVAYPSLIDTDYYQQFWKED